MDKFGKIDFYKNKQKQDRRNDRHFLPYLRDFFQRPVIGGGDIGCIGGCAHNRIDNYSEKNIQLEYKN